FTLWTPLPSPAVPWSASPRGAQLQAGSVGRGKGCGPNCGASWPNCSRRPANPRAAHGIQSQQLSGGFSLESRLRQLTLCFFNRPLTLAAGPRFERGAQLGGGASVAEPLQRLDARGECPADGDGFQLHTANADAHPAIDRVDMNSPAGSRVLGK